MNEQEFIKNWDLVDAWVNSMRPHWRHLKGNVHNDSDFWSQCIHSVRPEAWHAWCELYGELKSSHPELFRKYTHIYEDTVVVATRLDKGQAITKPYNKTGYNKPAFRAAMAIKDIVAEITERPFAVAPEETVKKRTRPTQAEAHAQWIKTRTMIDQLFEDSE